MTKVKDVQRGGPEKATTQIVWNSVRDCLPMDGRNVLVMLERTIVPSTSSFDPSFGWKGLFEHSCSGKPPRVEFWADYTLPEAR